LSVEEGNGGKNGRKRPRNGRPDELIMRSYEDIKRRREMNREE